MLVSGKACGVDVSKPLSLLHVLLHDLLPNLLPGLLRSASRFRNAMSQEARLNSTYASCVLYHIKSIWHSGA